MGAPELRGLEPSPTRRPGQDAAGRAARGNAPSPYVRRTAVLVLCAVAVGPPSSGEDVDRYCAAGKRAGRLAALVASLEGVGFSGAALAARDGKVLVAAGVGPADVDGRTANTANTLFELASATKQFTAAAILALEEDGRLDLDDDIARHLEGVPPDCRAITVRHLLQHTSGIPGTNSRGHGDDLALVLPLFLSGGPRHEPGTHWDYWNQGYAILSAIIDRVGGRDYVGYCKERLFERAGMRHGLFTGDEAPEGVPLATGRSARGEPRSALEHPYGSYGYQYRGMGGAVANLWDLWRWDRALRGDEVLGKAAREELFRPGLNDYALGWFVRRDERGRLVQSHGGAVRGFVCEIRRFPEEDGCLVVFGNRDDAPLPGVVGLLEATLFDEAIALPPAPLERGLQAALVGSYSAAGGRRLVVEAGGVATPARIEWRPGGDGPVTRGVLGLDDRGRPVFFDWARSTALELLREGDPVDGVRMESMEFRRTP
ncbi:MAG: beta-lactamase family protein [Planctomycetes bacterium]|nr:beta-lactamase family protein [Planctomycetota bacterium]